jgi:DNA polymerase-3 subunit beta
MHVVCERENLIKNISAVQRAVSGRSTLPVLNNVLMEAKAQELRLLATDLEIAIESKFPAQVKEEGSITFPSKYLLDIVRRLPSEEVEIRLEKGTLIHIESGKVHFSISGLASDEFPLLPQIKDGTNINIKPKNLKELVEHSAFASSKDEVTRPELSGILLVIHPDKVQAVGTDGNRLALREVEESTGLKEKQEVLIPSRALEEYLRISAEEEELEIVIGNNQMDFIMPTRKLTTRKIQSRFPNWEQVIPQSYEATFLVDTKKLQEALDRSYLLARLVANKVQLKGEGGVFRLLTIVPEVGSVEEEIEWAQGTANIELQFNARYLIEGLKGIETEYTFIGYTGRERPLVLRPSDEKGYLYLAMPLRA